MRRCCCCCVSLQKGVMAIGAISMICSIVLSVGYGAVAVTLEEHRESCMQGKAKDVLGILPACHVLADTSTLLAARIFVYVQVGLWILFLVFSILLIVAAVKEVVGLLVPWVVLAGLVMGAVIWTGVHAALQSRSLDLLTCVLSIMVIVYCCLVVRSYARYLKNRAHIPTFIPSMYSPQTCCQGNDHIRESGQTSTVVRDLPPAYTLLPHSPSKKSEKKKRPLPTGLGVKT